VSDETRQDPDDDVTGRMGDDPADKTQPAEGGRAEVIELPGAQGGDPSGAGVGSDANEPR
jgi:hypothetical protein